MRELLICGIYINTYKRKQKRLSSLLYKFLADSPITKDFLFRSFPSFIFLSIIRLIHSLIPSSLQEHLLLFPSDILLLFPKLASYVIALTKAHYTGGGCPAKGNTRVLYCLHCLLFLSEAQDHFGWRIPKGVLFVVSFASPCKLYTLVLLVVAWSSSFSCLKVQWVVVEVAVENERNK